MPNTDTAEQLSDLIRSVEARIETHQQERQALVTQLQGIQADRGALLVALIGDAKTTRGPGRPRTSGSMRLTTCTVSPATRKKMATAAKKRWAAKNDLKA